MNIIYKYELLLTHSKIKKYYFLNISKLMIEIIIHKFDIIKNIFTKNF